MEIYPSDVRFAIDVTEKISGMESVGVFDRIQKEALKLYECTIKIRTKKWQRSLKTFWTGRKRAFVRFNCNSQD